MDINLQIEAFDYPNQEDPRFSITLLPVEPPSGVPVLTGVQESFCSFCLRERPVDGTFYGYNIENCPIVQDTMADIFGPKFKLEKFSICTPCWNLVQLMDDFRTCCFEANSAAERIKSGLKAEDGWFTQDTLKWVEGMHSAIRGQLERIRTSTAEVIPDDVITIDDESDDELHSPKNLIIDESLEEHKLTVFDCPEDTIEMLPEIANSIIETSTTSVGQLPEVQQSTLDSADIEIPQHSIKIEAEDPDESISDEISIQLQFGEHQSPLLDPPTDNFAEEDATEASEQLEIPIHTIKTEVELPEDSMDAEHANEATGPEDYEEADEATMNESLFTEISIENIKVEKDEVGEKIAKLLNVRVSQCGRCGSSHKYRIGLINHMRNCRNQTAVGPDVMYTCQICWASYRSKTNFKAHINQHIDYKPYKCRLKCSKHFFGLKGRMKHEAKCNAFICCVVCDHTFPDKESLFGHIKAAHGKISFNCDICDMKFTTKPYLRRHCYNLHSERIGDFPCRRCKNHNSKTAYEANLHAKLCRMNFTYDCIMCGVRLRSACLLKAHMVAYHEEPKYDCNICGKKFKRHTTAMRHKLAHTEGKSKVPCPICNKMFSALGCLKKHMVQHAPVCPYPCPSCGKRFSSKQAMQTHVKMVCMEVGDKVQCQYCRKKYVLLSSLEKHVEEKHSKHLKRSSNDLDNQTQEV